MFSKATKNLLRSTIRQTDNYNRFMEEGEMWRMREERRERTRKEGRQPLRRAHMDGSDSDSSMLRRDGEAEDSPGRHGNRKSSYWMRELVKAEEEHGDRWGHSGYQEMYPEDFVSSYSSSDDEPASKKAKKAKKPLRDKKKKSKKSKNKKKHKHDKRRRSHSSSKSALIGPQPAAETSQVMNQDGASQGGCQHNDGTIADKESHDKPMGDTGRGLSKQEETAYIRKRKRRRSKYSYSSSDTSSDSDEPEETNHRPSKEKGARSSHRHKVKKGEVSKHRKHRKHKSKSAENM